MCFPFEPNGRPLILIGIFNLYSFSIICLRRYLNGLAVTFYFSLSLPEWYYMRTQMRICHRRCMDGRMHSSNYDILGLFSNRIAAEWQIYMEKMCCSRSVGFHFIFEYFYFIDSVCAHLKPNIYGGLCWARFAIAERLILRYECVDQWKSFCVTMEMNLVSIFSENTVFFEENGGKLTQCQEYCSTLQRLLFFIDLLKWETKEMNIFMFGKTLIQIK